MLPNDGRIIIQRSFKECDKEIVDWIFCNVGDEERSDGEKDIKRFEFMKCVECLDYPKD
jgi:hypothetical protein